jgi:RNA polymerase sigma factor (sigma-70 family)
MPPRPAKVADRAPGNPFLRHSNQRDEYGTPSPRVEPNRVSREMALPAPIEHDRVLASHVLAGDELAFRELYRRHTPRLYQLVLRLLGGRDADAEDAVQDTWLKATEQLDRFRWECAFGTWLSAIALNVAREQMRRRIRRPEADWPEDLDPPAAAPFDVVLSMDLERAVADLPDGYRAVLVLHDVEGYTHEEIGLAMGIAEGTSKSQLFWARQALRAKLGGRQKGIPA